MNSNLKIDLDSLRVVSAIVQHGSFSHAASALHRVPSTISYTIGKIEKALDIRIFNRDGHKIELTEEGNELYLRGEELLRVAYETESAIRHLSLGWEPELRIAIHDFFPIDRLMSVVKELQVAAPDTRLSISSEVLTGIWDALTADRVDFVIAIGTQMPEIGGFTSVVAGQMEFVFAISPDHPLAQCEEPIPEDRIRRYPSIAIADTARETPARTVAILHGQPVLTVSTPAMKLEAHLQGLGVGTLPKSMIRPYLESGQLVEKKLESGVRWKYPVVYAWKNKRKGNALNWLKRRLTDPDNPVVWFD